MIELFQRKEFVASIDATQSIAAIQAEIRRRFNLPAARRLTHRPSSAAHDRVAVTPLVHDDGMTSRTTPQDRSEQLTLLPEAAVPVQFRLDEATRRRGLRHIAEIRARLAARPGAPTHDGDRHRPAA